MAGIQKTAIVCASDDPSRFGPQDYGAGAIGGYLAVELSLAGHDVCVMNCPVRTSSFLAAAAAVIGLVGLCTFAEHVQAQANAPPAAVAPAPRLKLTAEQEYIIREIVLKDLNMQKENSAPETIGDSVPDDVKLYPLPPEVIQKVPQAQSHQFFVKDDEVVLVSSSDRRIADVIKKKPTD
jgi:hypothetical protein